MTIGLTHNTDLWRVQLALSGLNSAVSSVLVERSFNEVAWQTERGGTSLPISGGEGSLDSYEYAASADGSLTTHYRVTTLDPEPGLLLDGSAGDYASTPDHNDLDITGDMDLRCEVTLADWQFQQQTFVAKWNGNVGDERSYLFTVQENGALRLLWSEDGVGNLGDNSTEVIPADAGRLAVRVTLTDGDGEVRYFTGPTLDGPWTQLGDAITGSGPTSIYSGEAALTVGAYNAGDSGQLSGTVHAALAKSGAAIGSGSVRADPDFTAEESGTASFDDDAGRTWSVNGDAEIVTFETASIVVTQSEYVAKSIRFPLLNRSVKIGDYSDLERPAQLGVHAVTGRSFPVATTDVNSSVRFQMEFVTETEDEARRLKLLLALGDILYLQSPAEVNTRRPPRSMYVVADSSAVGRIGIGTHRRHTVPFTEVAKPSALVSGTTLTWQNVWNTFGSWSSLISADPSWSDLLATVGSGDDLVVL